MGDSMNNQKERIKDIYQLTPMQEGMLYHSLLDNESYAYFEQIILIINGKLDINCLKESFNKLIERYDILRTAFIYEKVDKPIQIVLNHQKNDILFENIVQLSKEDKRAFVEEFKTKDRRKGFDLTDGKPIRLAVIKTDETSYNLIWSFHHIIMDGWCMGIIFKEFLEIYGSLKENKQLNLPKVYPYSNYIKWLERQDSEKAATFWEKYLNSYEEQSALPKSSNISLNKGYEPQEVHFTLNREGLEKIAHENNVTLNTIIQAVWGIILQKYNNTDDVVFGAVISGRPPEIQGIESMVGLFINTIPVRVQCDENKSFKDLLKEVQKSSIQSDKYGYYPLAEIQSQTDLKQNLIDHILVFENYPIEETIGSLNNKKLGFNIENIEFFDQTNYDLNIIIVPGKELDIKFTYNALIYDKNTIEKIKEHFKTTLKGIIRNQDIPIKDIEILNQEEKHQLLYDFNNVNAEYPKNKTIHELFEEQVNKTPDNTAVVFENDQLTYMELNEKSNQMARILSDNGVMPDDIVGIMVERSLDMIVSILGVLKAGGAYLPIDPEYPSDRISYMLKDSGASVLIQKNRKYDIFFEGTIVDINEEKLSAIESTNLNKIISPSNLAYIIYTSGTTGKPKGVMIEHSNVVRLMFNNRMPFDFDENDVWTMFHSFNFDFSVWEMYGALLYGGKLVIVPKLTTQDTSEFLKLLYEEKVTILNQTPTAFYNLIEEDLKYNDSELGIRCVIFGGETLKPIMLKDWRKKYPQTRLINMYGITETTVHVSFKEITEYEIELNISNVGKPIPTVTTYIMDRNMKLLPVGVAGELYVGGDGVARGYLNNIELTAQKFVQNPYKHGEKLYKSGDIAKFMYGGDIEYLGRIDHQVKIRGFRIELGEIEISLLKHPLIKEAVTISKEDKSGSNYICAYFIGEEELKTAQLRKYLSNDLPDYMIPSYFIQLEKMPLTLNGKIDRKALPEPDGIINTGVEYVAPADEVEERLLLLWQNVLEIEIISTIDNFFDLGGHSLKATILVSRIHKEFNVEFPLREVFKSPTIIEMAKYIKKAQKSVYSSIQPVEKREYYPMSSAQKRLYILDQFESTGITYNMPGMMIIEGNLDIIHFEEVFGEIIRRHETLRTSFTMVDGEPVQRVHNNVDFAVIYSESTEEKVDEIAREFIKPFDLRYAPLLRVGLVKIQKNKYLMLFDMHHIISDGTSMGILVQEFISLYEGKKLPELRIQYKDYSSWQNEIYTNEFIKCQENHWLESFKGEVPVLNMLLDYPRPVIQSFEGDRINFKVGKELTEKLNSIAKDSGATLYMVLLAAFNTLLFKYTGQKDIVIGSPIAGRPHADLQGIIGMFVNTLAMRNYPKGEKTFNEFLGEVKENALNAYENQDYQFEELVEKLDLNRDLSRNPLFDAMFALQNMDIVDFELEGLKFTPYESQFQIAKFDITLNATEIEDIIAFNLEYCTKLFKKETIQRLERHYVNILEQIVENPDLKLKDVDMLTEEEKNTILFDFNNTQAEYPKDKTIHELFEEQVEKTQDNIAVMFDNEQLTYGELNKKANQLARMLTDKGIGPDNIVAIMMDRSIELIIGIFGILKAGGAYLPVDPNYPEERIVSMLNDSNVKLIVTKESEIKIPFCKLQGLDNSSDGMIFTNSRPQIIDFDSLPIPDRTLVDYTKYHKHIGLGAAKNSISIQATRGCPYHCAFCHKIWPRNHVVRSAENIFQEIQLYYNVGIRRFVFIDDIFNINIKNSSKLFELIIENDLDIQLYFPNGLRGDILTKEYIDLMVKAGTVNLSLALETASPRLQKLVGKNMNIAKLKDNINYILENHPQVIVELESMHGFPTESEEEARMTLNFIKEIKWLHFPYIHMLKIYPNTDMVKLAEESGISKESIEKNSTLAYHEVPDTLPFTKSFTLKYQADFLNNYFLLKERLLYVLPLQMKVMTESELVAKYNSYLPVTIHKFDDLLNFLHISVEELGDVSFVDETYGVVSDFNEIIKNYFPKNGHNKDALRVLFLDLSQLFTEDSRMVYDVTEAPLGQMYLLTYLNNIFGKKLHGKIAKSRIDFDNYDELKELVEKFKPDIISIRTLTIYKDFFHKSVSIMRQWGINVPIIAGGPYATSDSSNILNDSNINLIILGEGELTLAEIIEKMINNDKKLPGNEILGTIPGIGFVESKDTSSGREIIDMDNMGVQLEEYSFENLPCVCKPENLLYVIYTSGSTGKPKGVMIEHKNIVNLLYYEFNETNIDFSEKVLQFNNMSFDVCYQEIFSTLSCGGELNIIDEEIRTDVKKLMGFIKEKGIQTIFLPTSYLKFISTDKEYMGSFPDTLKHIITAGEQLTVNDLLNNYIKTEKALLHNHYGPSETHVVSTITLGRDKKIPLIPPIGKPISNTKMYILGENLEIQPVGVKGELYIAGKSVGRGYLNLKELNNERFINNPFVSGEKMYKTGDLARWLPDGNIDFMGRNDHQVKIRGYRIELGEIKSQLLDNDAIKEAIVVNKEDKQGNIYLCAYLVCDREVESLDLKGYLSEKLADYMIPSYFIQLEMMPLTPNGKIDRKSLPEPDGNINTGIEYIAPTDEVEEKLVLLWQDILGIEKVGIIDNFFDLGGHSLKATTLVSRIHKEFNVEFPLREVFNLPTIIEMAEYIKNVREIIYSSIQPVEKRGYYPMSSAQKRLYILDQFDNAGTAYNMPSIWVVNGKLDVARFEWSFRELIERHDALRTSFDMINGEPVQRVHDEIDFNIDYRELTEEKAEEIAREFIKHFDLSQAPLLRVGLIKVQEDKYLMLFDMHHIISDGTSMGILVQEFINSYESKELPELRVQYKDYSVWQNELYNDEIIKNQENYWLDRFNADIPVLNMPLDYLRPVIQSFEGDRINFKVGKELTEKLNSIAKDSGATLYMVLLAAFNTLLFKYTGQEDIVVGSAIAGRPHADLQGIIGMFVNTLAMRNYPEREKTFDGFLDDVKATALSAYENQDYQFEELVEKLDLNRNLNRNPLFDVMFTLQNMDMADLEIEGLNFTLYDNQFQIAKFDITLFATETEEGISFELEYCTELFKMETIHRLKGHYVNILEQVTENPGVKLKDVDMLTEEDKNTILFDFNNTQTEYPKDRTINELFEEQVDKTPDNTALVFEGKQLTYMELNEKANQLAKYLKTEHDVKPDLFVGIIMERSLDIIVGILGILKAGGAYVPIDPDYPFERIKTIINDSGVNVVVSTQKQIKTLNKLQWECEKFNTFICLDSDDVHLPEDAENHEFMDKKLWEYVANTSTNDIGAGGWINSYTGDEFSEKEMEEYSDNTFQKLKPYLNINKRVLEVGCASGLSMYKISPYVASYYGTDLSNVIIEKNNQRIINEGFENIKVECLSAHEIDKLKSNEFDIIIINSVIQCFPGYNYLKDVISKSISLLSPRGILYIGDVMDHDLKPSLVQSLIEFKLNNPEYRNKTKTDFSNELFVSREFFEDLLVDYPEISAVEFSGKNYTIENELTKFRYDCIITIDKTQKTGIKSQIKHKNQHGMSILNKYNTNSILSATKPHNLAYVMYTSGSTGKPKGVMVEHRNVVRLVKNTNYINFKKDDRILQTGAPAFDASTFEIWGALLNGLKLYLVDDNTLLNVDKLYQAVVKYEITTMWLTSPLFNQISTYMPEVFKTLKNLLVGGDVLLPERINAVRNVCKGLNMVNGYGPTENTTFSVCLAIDKDYKDNIPIGKPISNSTAYVLDKNDKPQPIGVMGELCVGGDGLARGYLNNPELTREKFVDNPSVLGERMYRTGDLVKWLPGGNIEFIGRMDDQVKIRGFRIELGEIESQLLKHPLISETVVLSKEDQNDGKYLCAYFTGEKELTVTQLREYLSSNLPDYMIPSYFIQLEKMPLTPNGKIDKIMLPEPDGIINTGVEYIAPSNEIEEKLVLLWQDILQIIRVSTKDNFFELGGHSLKATTLVSRIHKEFNVDFPLREVFNLPTIMEMARYLKNAKKSIYSSIRPAEKQEYYPMSSAQKRLYILDQFESTGTAYNMPGTMIIEGKLDNIRFEWSFRELIERHETLRTSFAMIDGELVQRVNEINFNITYLESTEEKAVEIAREFIKTFDLDQAPLLRVGLVKIGKNKHLMLFDMHHIVSDGTSMGILVQEFISLYEGKELPELSIQYKDYSVWQNKMYNDEIVKNQEEYWLDRFSGDIPVLNMPLDYARPVIQSFEGDRINFKVGKELTEKLNSIAKDSGATLYMVLLAAFNTLLFKYTGQEDIVVGSAIAGRPHVDLQGIIGMFVNTLAMRNYPEGEKTFDGFLDDVKATALSAYENQDYQFEELVEKLNIKHDISRNPLFDVMFALQNMDRADLEIEGLKFAPYENQFLKAKFDIAMDATETEEGILFNLEYCTDLFNKETIQRLKKHYVNILEQIIENPGVKLKDVDMLTEEEKKQMLNGIIKDFKAEGADFNF
jgi:amino acid adenylation domain-containing protein